MNKCIFCKIVNKQAPATIIFEDEVVLAIMPLEQVSKGHTLLLPKKHFENIFDIDEEIFIHLSKVMKKLSNKLVKENNLTDDLYRVVVNGGKAQHVPHLHFHLLGGQWKKFV